MPAPTVHRVYLQGVPSTVMIAIGSCKLKPLLYPAQTFDNSVSPVYFNGSSVISETFVVDTDQLK